MTGYNAAMLQKLKRTVAVACLLATACFVILWMRSLKQWDYVLYVGASLGMLELSSSDGMLSFSRAHSIEFQRSDGDGELGYHLMTLARPASSESVSILKLPGLHFEKGTYAVYIQFWLLILLSGSIGTGLLIKRPFSFSLRTLAIASTLIIVTLGCGVAASRLTLG